MAADWTVTYPHQHPPRTSESVAGSARGVAQFGTHTTASATKTPPPSAQDHSLLSKAIAPTHPRMQQRGQLQLLKPKLTPPPFLPNTAERVTKHALCPPSKPQRPRGTLTQ
ncbi:hypothetical protein M758_UG011400 [Ceratodon purpureus]|nr:hypothetical protein M758_UG011400 [Ceratodon purpureus]